MEREIRFEYGFESVNGIVKKSYALSEIPNIKEKCDVWGMLPIVYVRQWTGLKDKNGKEIYEGDIVRVIECECVGQSADGSEEEWIECEGEVSFEDGMFVFDGHSAGTLPMSAYKDSFEVIGNIYENKDLL